MVKTLAKSLRQHKKASWFTIIFSMLEVVFEVVIPLYMSKLIDFGVERASFREVGKYAVILFVFAGVELFVGVLAANIAAKASAGFAANLRQDMYNNMQTFSFANIDKFSTASIVTRLTTDVTNIQNAYQILIRLATRCPAMMIFSIVASFVISKKLSLIFLATIPVLSIFLYVIIRVAHPVFEKVFQTYDRLNNIVQENIKGVRVVKSFNREKHETNKFKHISNKIYHNFAKGERLISINFPIMQLCVYVCIIFISWFGAKAVVASGNNIEIGLTTGGLMALVTYAFLVMMSLMILSFVFIVITVATTSAVRVSELLNEKTEISNPTDPVVKVENGEINFVDVSFVYDSNAAEKVLSHINLHIAEGETVGIIGGVGSAKTSLVQLIPRLYDVAEGSVFVGGVDVRQYDLEILRSEVAMVLQKNELFSGTIKDNLLWGNPQATDTEIREACRLACASEFINALPKGYDTYIEQGGVNVSGGQKQRLCIARALLKKPKILIFDDSTSAVDVKTDRLIQHTLSKHIPETTKIIIAQRISSVENAHKIVVLDKGKISALGTHTELLKTSEIYREVFESQKKGCASNE